MKNITVNELKSAMILGDHTMMSWYGIGGYELRQNRRGDIVKSKILDTDATCTRVLTRVWQQRNMLDSLELQKVQHSSIRATEYTFREIDDMREALNKTYWYALRELSKLTYQENGEFLLPNLKKEADGDPVVLEELKIDLLQEVDELLDAIVAQATAV